jgi:hypothetical protein
VGRIGEEAFLNCVSLKRFTIQSNISVIKLCDYCEEDGCWTYSDDDGWWYYYDYDGWRSERDDYENCWDDLFYYSYST